MRQSDGQQRARRKPKHAQEHTDRAFEHAEVRRTQLRYRAAVEALAALEAAHRQSAAADSIDLAALDEALSALERLAEPLPLARPPSATLSPPSAPSAALP